MPIDDNYHLDFKSVSNTMLKHLDDVEKYYHYYVSMDRRPPNLGSKTQVMVGQVVHQILLEKVPVEEVLCHYTLSCFKSNGTLNPKPAKEFREQAEAEGKIVVKDDEFRRIMEICNAVNRHPLGRLLEKEGMIFEQPIYWTDNTTGIDCRACPDFAYNCGDEVLCYDLKITERANPRQWSRLAKKFAYYQQDAHYSSGLAHITGLPVRFVFWVVESVWPYRIAQYEYDAISRERAGEAYQLRLKELARRKKKNDWSDAWTQESNYLAVEPWDVPDLEDELEGFDE